MTAKQESPAVTVAYYVDDPETAPEFRVLENLYLAVPLQAFVREGERRTAVTVPFLHRLVDLHLPSDLAYMETKWNQALGALKNQGGEVQVVGPDHDEYYLQIPQPRSAAD